MSPDETTGTPLGPRTWTSAFRSPERKAPTSALTASSRESKLFCPGGSANTAPCKPIASTSAMLRAFIAALRLRLHLSLRRPPPPPSPLLAEPAVGVARSGLGTVAAAVLLLGALVAILGALAVRRIVIERLLAALALATVPLVLDLGGLVPAVHVVGEVVGLVDVDVDVAATPVTAAPDRRADRHPHAERDRRRAPGVGRRIRVVRRIGRRVGPVEDGRVVG